MRSLKMWQKLTKKEISNWRKFDSPWSHAKHLTYAINIHQWSMAFKIIDLPVTLGTLGFIKVLKDLKEESLDKKQFHLTDINIFAKYMQESEKCNPSVFNLLSSWFHEIGYAHCHEWCFLDCNASPLLFIVNAWKRIGETRSKRYWEIKS